MAESRHPGISMHKLPVGPGFIGLVFTVGCALIFLLGLPQLWYFVAFSAAFGLILAILFRVFRQDREQRMKLLSILDAAQNPKPGPAEEPVEETKRPSNLISAVPVPGRA
jgi:membrane protein implicated in regulation of membrane protease activity